MFAAIAGKVLGGICSIVDQVVEDKDMANKLKAELHAKGLDLISQELKGSISIILAESRGNLIQRSWRPILMLTVVAIVANNYIIVPYAVAFGAPIPMLELPDKLWTLLTIGVGGYVVGRSGEKMVESYRKGKKG